MPDSRHISINILVNLHIDGDGNVTAEANVADRKVIAPVTAVVQEPETRPEPVAPAEPRYCIICGDKLPDNSNARRQICGKISCVKERMRRYGRKQANEEIKPVAMAPTPAVSEKTVEPRRAPSDFPQAPPRLKLRRVKLPSTPGYIAPRLTGGTSGHRPYP